jgi:hypothetical protein
MLFKHDYLRKRLLRLLKIEDVWDMALQLLASGQALDRLLALLMNEYLYLPMTIFAAARSFLQQRVRGLIVSRLQHIVSMLFVPVWFIYMATNNVTAANPINVLKTWAMHVGSFVPHPH